MVEQPVMTFLLGRGRVGVFCRGSRVLEGEGMAVERERRGRRERRTPWDSMVEFPNVKQGLSVATV